MKKKKKSQKKSLNSVNDNCWNVMRRWKLHLKCKWQGRHQALNKTDRVRAIQYEKAEQWIMVAMNLFLDEICLLQKWNSQMEIHIKRIEENYMEKDKWTRNWLRKISCKSNLLALETLRGLPPKSTASNIFMSFFFFNLLI